MGKYQKNIEAARSVTIMQYLATCRKTGRKAAEFYGWTVIQCVRDGAMRSVEDIHDEIYRHVKKCLEV